MSQLLEELKPIQSAKLNESNSQEFKSESSTSNSNNNNPSPIKWSEQRVAEWFTNKKINQIIVDCLKPCDGKLLFKYYSIKKEAPAYFYESLRNKCKIVAESSAESSICSSTTATTNVPTLANFLLFSRELNFLFE
jgi:hypothetical protein